MRPLLLLSANLFSVAAAASARVISDKLGARLGQSLVVENRPGASGNIGPLQVAASSASTARWS